MTGPGIALAMQPGQRTEHVLPDQLLDRLAGLGTLLDRQPLENFDDERARRVLADTEILITGWGAAEVSLSLMILGLAVVGLGVGFGRPSNVTSITNSVGPGDVGIATGVMNMTGQIGTAIGITVLLAMVGDSDAPSTFVDASIVAAAIAAVSIVTA